MVIYGSTLSPFVRKVVAVATAKGADFTLKRINRGSQNPEFLAASPLGKMPALRDGDFTLADSTAIAFYLDARYGGAPLIPAGAQARAQVIWWDEFADTELFGCLRPMFFNRIVCPLFMGQAGDEAAARAGETELPRLLGYLERVLPEPGVFLVGDGLTLADLALASPFANLAHLRGDLAAFPRVQRWSESMLSGPAFATMIAEENALIGRARDRQTPG
jgi:glutathione S-transferase